MSIEFNLELWFCMIAIWVIVLILNSNGVHSMKWIYYFSVPLSLVFLFVMLLFGIILGDGVSEGVREYLFGKSDEGETMWNALMKYDLWTDAAVQTLYSIGVAYWTTYGSYIPIRNPVLGDSLKISIYDTIYAFFAGIAMFSVLGYLRSVEVPLGGESGLEMMYVGLPSAISLTTDSPRFWLCCLFLTFLTFGLDTIIGWVETVVTIIYDIP